MGFVRHKGIEGTDFRHEGSSSGLSCRLARFRGARSAWFLLLQRLQRGWVFGIGFCDTLSAVWLGRIGLFLLLRIKAKEPLFSLLGLF